MKITRHAAPDMRQALKAVREQVGPDAVILSSRRTSTGVEVTAAMDFDSESLQSSDAAASAPAPMAAAAREPALNTAAGNVAPAAASVPTAASSVVAMESELKTLRRILETQLAQLAWKDLARRAPIHTEMLRELTEVGLTPDLAAEVVTAVPAGMELTGARRLTISSIAQRLLVTGDRWLQEGGRIALVGPTGVGKSATLAKLAVRWVLLHGPRDLAL
ncbi:MAG: hypothetical protein WBE92_09310, partial [Steroidobacteraceae bacterium]